MDKKEIQIAFVNGLKGADMDKQEKYKYMVKQVFNELEKQYKKYDKDA